MFIPISTDYRLTRRPWVNYAIIAVNVAIYVLGYNGATESSFARVSGALLDPEAPEVRQFFTSAFLHGGLAHLLGNMVFLWVFGNAVNDRFGHAGYLAFYLAGGVLSGLGYLLLAGHAPVLGASGAISAVTGAYLVLFPRVRVRLLVFYFLITTLEVSSLVFLLFQFVWNVAMSLVPGIAGPGGGGGVAYVAHSSGYAFGIAMAAALLAARVLPREPFDLINLIRASRRRHRYRHIVAGGYDPFGRGGMPQPGGRWVDSKSVESAAADDRASRQLELRREISQACSNGELRGATERYLQLVQIADDAVLPRQQQLEVANYLMSTDRHPAAADAYERFLRHYGDYEHVSDIHLMLGLLYGRYLHQYDQAEQYLQQAIRGLGDQRKVDLARADLEMVRMRRGH